MQGDVYGRVSRMNMPLKQGTLKSADFSSLTLVWGRIILCARMLPIYLDFVYVVAVGEGIDQIWQYVSLVVLGREGDLVDLLCVGLMEGAADDMHRLAYFQSVCNHICTHQR